MLASGALSANLLTALSGLGSENNYTLVPPHANPKKSIWLASWSEGAATPHCFFSLLS